MVLLPKGFSDIKGEGLSFIYYELYTVVSVVKRICFWI